MIRTVATLLGLFALAACESRPRVRAVVQRGVAAQGFAIRLEAEQPPTDAGDRSVSVDAVIVGTRAIGRSDQLTSHRFWTIMRRPEAPALELPVTFRYGTPPPGYAADRASPVALPPGEYQVEVQAGGTHAITRFDVSNRGMIE
jgi:hypothetical protein